MVSSLDPQPLRQQAYRLLKEAIINGELSEHTLLTERLALETYAIGKTPFREAIQVLESEGWVNKIPYKGTYVTPITDQDIKDLFELRIYLEASILRTWNSDSHFSAIAKLKGIAKQMQAHHLSDQNFMQLDKDFHAVIYNETGNQRLITIYDQIKDSIRRIGLQIMNQQRRQQVIEEHCSIIEGIADQTAARAITDHLLNQKQAFLDHYKDRL
ncbi:GntR family transcriptional regulator [Pullulanibacillus camelliae]|uniref:GntR family transcriptional regulator n=1 Tax=Pullulanibacillus camelliae TaxID=1707096 RepID=A0A8J2YAJ0_9BACL|nr:GntR family transcriptional regulator [Pullulanibacillus camelliae]GGE29426.1 GntR family transcriptional regulator [Pullulanibacillus camelliae]